MSQKFNKTYQEPQLDITVSEFNAVQKSKLHHAYTTP
jgi:hypothetical protein